MVEDWARFKLCYVTERFAFFTTKDVKAQWGDDWDDIPYEHNAGRPYTYDDHDRKRGDEPWEIKRVAWEGPFDLPCDHYGSNSPYSVKAINAGAVSWMKTDKWTKLSVIIPAGTTLPDFIQLVRSAGGEVYLPSSEVL